MRYLAVGGPADGHVVEVGDDPVIITPPDGVDGVYVRVKMSPAITVYQFMPKPRSRWQKKAKHVDWGLSSAT